jgi:hypothetical protein
MVALNFRSFECGWVVASCYVVPALQPGRTHGAATQLWLKFATAPYLGDKWVLYTET